jgi:hypothetical protein
MRGVRHAVPIQSSNSRQIESSEIQVATRRSSVLRSSTGRSSLADSNGERLINYLSLIAPQRDGRNRDPLFR